jgi:hypothetical protein
MDNHAHLIAIPHGGSGSKTSGTESLG